MRHVSHIFIKNMSNVLIFFGKEDEIYILTMIHLQ